MYKIIILLKKIKKRYTPWYRSDYNKFLKLNNGNLDFEIKDSYPCLKERYMSSGIASGHYFHQDIYVAKKIYDAKPKKHIDVGSRIDGFVAHVAIFREIEVFDIRPLNHNIKNVIFRQLDFMKEASLYHGYCDSLSSLHTLEHFGLGRYGDEIDPKGHLKGFEVMSNILISGGIFYFSVPMGRNRVEFNGQRIFSLSYLLNWCNEKFEVIKFSYIDDSYNIHEEIKLNDEMIDNNCNCNNGCAIFVLKKK